MPTLPKTLELEKRLEAEAAKRGMGASEYALRLLESFVPPEPVHDPAEQARWEAIDALMGAADSSFSTAELRRERDSEEECHFNRFGQEHNRRF